MPAEAYVIDTKEGGPKHRELTVIVELNPPLDPQTIRRHGMFVDDSPTIKPIRYAEVSHERGGNSLFATNRDGHREYKEVVVYQKNPSSIREFLQRLGYDLKASDEELVSRNTYEDAAKKNLYVGLTAGTVMGVLLTSVFKSKP